MNENNTDPKAYSTKLFQTNNNKYLFLNKTLEYYHAPVLLLLPGTISEKVLKITTDTIHVPELHTLFTFILTSNRHDIAYAGATKAWDEIYQSS